MTTQNPFGTDVSSQDKITVEGDLDELKAGGGISIGDTKYEYGADLHSGNVPLIDLATGKTISIRTFEFKINPTLKELPADRQLIFNTHAKQIATILWGDGLIPYEPVAPRVIVDLKGGKYQIFVPCQARLSTVFAEKPRSLTDQLQDETTRH